MRDRVPRPKQALRIAATPLANLVRRGNALKAVHELNFGNSTFGVSKF